MKTSDAPGKNTAFEAELRRRFETRTETFAHGAFAAELLLPVRAEDLIDEAEFDADERLPYWADLWPSARALARHLLDDPPPSRRVLLADPGRVYLTGFRARMEAAGWRISERVLEEPASPPNPTPASHVRILELRSPRV